MASERALNLIADLAAAWKMEYFVTVEAACCCWLTKPFFPMEKETLYFLRDIFLFFYRFSMSDSRSF